MAVSESTKLQLKRNMYLSLGVTLRSRLKCVLGLVVEAGHEAPSKQLTLRFTSKITVSPGHADWGILSLRTNPLTSNASVNVISV